jgi:trimethylamine:corrinoid methyltransferase-like protein
LNKSGKYALIYVEAIHQATLRILGEVGVILSQVEAGEVLAAAGATLRGDPFLLPPDLVELSLAQCSSQVTIRYRSGATMVLGDGNLSWHNLGGASNVYEPRIGQQLFDSGKAKAESPCPMGNASDSASRC